MACRIDGLHGSDVERAEFAVSVPLRIAIAHDRAAIEDSNFVVAFSAGALGATFRRRVIAVLLVGEAERVYNSCAATA